MNGLRSVFSLYILVSLLVVASRAAERVERLVNLSSRANVGVGAQAMVAGFIVGEGAPKQILIRAVGPSLAQFPGLADLALKKPYLEVFDHRGAKLFENTSWRRGTFGTLATAADFASVGAFSLVSDEDAALLVTLAPGAYTAQVSAENRGVGLIEVYDVSGNARLLNLSTRAQLQSPSDIVISGLVVASGAAPKRLLVRAMGPSLTR
ncbi:MAG TPA: hypothetical protein PLN52_23950, partial [Opitutaceae bacterium]|nr:hypothetical protein [Opitutaceae bacterium]